MAEFAPGFTHFGSNAANEGYAWDWRPERRSLYAVLPLIGPDPEAAIPCGDTFEPSWALSSTGSRSNMGRWPDGWPDEVARFHERLALQSNWPAHVIEGVVANVEYLRTLSASDRTRHYLQGQFEGTLWLFEAVEDRGELVAIRQVAIGPGRDAHHYWWGCREDDVGFLTDQALSPDCGLQPLSADEFAAAWPGYDRSQTD